MASFEYSQECLRREIFNLLHHTSHPAASKFLDMHKVKPRRDSRIDHSPSQLSRPIVDVEALDRKVQFHQMVPIKKWYSVEFHERKGFAPMQEGECQSHGEYGLYSNGVIVCVPRIFTELTLCKLQS